MTIYILIFLVTAIIAYRQLKGKIKPSATSFYLYTLALGVFVGISDMLGGYDRYIYCDLYTSMSIAVERGEGFLNDTFLFRFYNEPLYGLVNELIGLFTPNRYVFILTYTLIVYTIYGICFYRYTEKPFFALLVFMGLMFFFTFTYLRQILAVGIVWLALPYYVKRNSRKYFGMIVLAALTHNSAAIMAFLYFLPIKILINF